MKQVGCAMCEVSDTSSDQTGESEIVQQLKDAFHVSTKKSLANHGRCCSAILDGYLQPHPWPRSEYGPCFSSLDGTICCKDYSCRQRNISVHYPSKRREECLEQSEFI